LKSITVICSTEDPDGIEYVDGGLTDKDHFRTAFNRFSYHSNSFRAFHWHSDSACVSESFSVSLLSSNSVVKY
jgi:hypothetical protein